VVGTALQWSYKAAGKLGVATRLLAPNRGDPAVLMYHGALSESGGVAERGDHKHVGESLFREQLSMLATHRRVVPLSQLVETLLAGGNCLGMVALTFDDGYLNNVECAARVLKEYSMSAAFFLATGFIGVQRWVWTDRLEYIVEVAEPQDTMVSWSDGGGTQHVRFGSPAERAAFIKQMKAALKHLDWNVAESRVRELSAVLHVPEAPPHGRYRFMSWDHVRQLVKDGFEVGAHTVNHAILSRVPLKSAEEEILVSQARVREETGTCCPVFCYPNGKASDFTSEVQEICARNFAAALSAEPGHARREDRFELRRISVDHSSSVDKLAARILEGGR
jgi:peptidoglycan/xylan/chitin deacetylase (PgdA/CDA1 family)